MFCAFRRNLKKLFQSGKVHLPASDRSCPRDKGFFEEIRVIPSGKSRCFVDNSVRNPVISGFLTPLSTVIMTKGSLPQSGRK